jgi:hypothetical protein
MLTKINLGTRETWEKALENLVEKSNIDIVVGLGLDGKRERWCLRNRCT